MKFLLVLLAACLTGMAAERFIEGTANSPVKVLIYEDLQCPDCADLRHMLDDRLLPKYGSRVTFEHRDFPLTKHAWARKAAVAARFFDEGGHRWCDVSTLLL
jgi:protein-disulfide isomerase